MSNQLRQIYSFDKKQVSAKNCENLIGSVEVPVGLAGPVEARVFIGQGSRADGEKLTLKLPLATTEGALVASVNRGCKAINLGQDTRVFVKNVGMSRAPVFALGDGLEAIKFEDWLGQSFNKIKQSCEKTSNHLLLKNFKTWVVGRQVFARFVFDTDQAMGMNMVTIALKQVWEEVISSYEGVELVSISSNVCVDKKPSAINQILGRGWQVQAEVFLNEGVLNKLLKTNAAKLTRAHQTKNLRGSSLAGSTAQNMHAANMVAALFLATGQDAAHVVEGAQAWTSIEEVEKEGVYFAVNLPNLNLATVGGGTYLPAFKQARKLILGRELKTAELAAAVGLAVLAGEISGLAALTSHQLAAAHQRLARSNDEV